MAILMLMQFCNCGCHHQPCSAVAAVDGGGSNGCHFCWRLQLLTEAMVVFVDGNSKGGLWGGQTRAQGWGCPCGMMPSRGDSKGKSNGNSKGNSKGNSNSNSKRDCKGNGNGDGKGKRVRVTASRQQQQLSTSAAALLFRRCCSATPLPLTYPASAAAMCLQQQWQGWVWVAEQRSSRVMVVGGVWLCRQSLTQKSCDRVIFVLVPTRMLIKNQRHFDKLPTCCQHIANIPS